MAYVEKGRSWWCVVPGTDGRGRDATFSSRLARSFAKIKTLALTFNTGPAAPASNSDDDSTHPGAVASNYAVTPRDGTTTDAQRYQPFINVSKAKAGRGALRPHEEQRLLPQRVGNLPPSTELSAK